MILHGRHEQERLIDRELGRSISDLPKGYIVKERLYKTGHLWWARERYQYCMLKKVGLSFQIVSFFPSEEKDGCNYESSTWVSAQTIASFIYGYEQRKPEVNELVKEARDSYTRETVLSEKVHFLTSKLDELSLKTSDEVWNLLKKDIDVSKTKQPDMKTKPQKDELET